MAVFENFPYTNVHELNLNWVVKNMKQLLEDWDAFTTNVDATAVSGSSADVEVLGSLKEGLTFKFTLPKGDRGDTGETGNGIDTVLFNPNYSLTFNFTNGTSYTTPSLRGAQGEGLKINDTYPTIEALEQAHPTGVEGDAYLIGTDPNFVLYIWSTRLNDYAMVGALTSPQPTETTPLMDGVAYAGDEYAYARGDHRHPSDTSKVDVTTYNQAIQGILEDINDINTTIQGISGNVSTNTSNIGNLTNLTTTDKTNLVNAINEVSSAHSIDLLWTNSSTSVDFAAQSVNLDLSEYQIIIISFVRYKSDTTRVYQLQFKGDNTTSTHNYGGRIIQRPALATDTKVEFFGGSVFSTYGTATSDDGCLIPVNIYGIK